MFVRSRGVWFGFAEKMFMFCSAKSGNLVFSAKTTVIPYFKIIFIYEQWLVITAS